MYPVAKIPFNFTIPIRFGKGPKTGLEFKFWQAQGAPKTWRNAPQQPDPPYLWTDWESQTPTGYTLVDHIQCCKGPFGPPGFPMPPSPPLPPTPPLGVVTPV